MRRNALTILLVAHLAAVSLSDSKLDETKSRILMAKSKLNAPYFEHVDAVPQSVAEDKRAAVLLRRRSSADSEPEDQSKVTARLYKLPVAAQEEDNYDRKFRGDIMRKRTLFDTNYPYGVVFGNGHPIGILKPYPQSFELAPIREVRVPERDRVGRSPKADADESESVSSEQVDDIARFTNDKYPEVLTDFKIKNRVLKLKEQRGTGMTDINAASGGSAPQTRLANKPVASSSSSPSGTPAVAKAVNKREAKTSDDHSIDEIENTLKGIINQLDLRLDKEHLKGAFDKRDAGDKSDDYVGGGDEAVKSRDNEASEDEDMEVGTNKIDIHKDQHDMNRAKKEGQARKLSKGKLDKVHPYTGNIKLKESYGSESEINDDVERRFEDTMQPAEKRSPLDSPPSALTSKKIASDYKGIGEAYLRNKRENSNNPTQDTDIVKGLESSGELTVSGNKSPLASSNEESDLNKAKVTKKSTDENLALEKNIQDQIKAIKEQVKREIDELQSTQSEAKSPIAVNRVKRANQNTLVDIEKNLLGETIDAESLKPLQRNKRDFDNNVNEAFNDCSTSKSIKANQKDEVAGSDREKRKSETKDAKNILKASTKDVEKRYVKERKFEKEPSSVDDEQSDDAEEMPIQHKKMNVRSNHLIKFVEKAVPADSEDFEKGNSDAIESSKNSAKYNNYNSEEVDDQAEKSSSSDSAISPVDKYKRRDEDDSETDSDDERSSPKENCKAKDNRLKRKHNKDMTDDDLDTREEKRASQLKVKRRKAYENKPSQSEDAEASSKDDDNDEMQIEKRSIKLSKRNEDIAESAFSENLHRIQQLNKEMKRKKLDVKGDTPVADEEKFDNPEKRKRSANVHSKGSQESDKKKREDESEQNIVKERDKRTEAEEAIDNPTSKEQKLEKRTRREEERDKMTESANDIRADRKKREGIFDASKYESTSKVKKDISNSAAPSLKRGTNEKRVSDVIISHLTQNELSEDDEKRKKRSADTNSKSRALSKQQNGEEASEHLSAKRHQRAAAKKTKKCDKGQKLRRDIKASKKKQRDVKTQLKLDKRTAAAAVATGTADSKATKCATKPPLVKREEKTAGIGDSKAQAVRTKRSSANMLYYPYREDEEEVDEEGDEFDDDGFEDRTANFVKKRDVSYGDYKDDAVGAPDPERITKRKSLLHDYVVNMNADAYENPNEFLYDKSRYSRTKRQDLDDEDFSMLQSGKRRSITRRAANMKTQQAKEADRNERQRLDDIYGLSDADIFGSLSQSYEGELSRFKRVKRAAKNGG